MNQANRRGFTIVELLVVIVVVAVLAAISVIAYNGIQGRARDAQRIQDMKTIQKALELYKVTHGGYPPTIVTPDAAGWELSTNGAFLPAPFRAFPLIRRIIMRVVAQVGIITVGRIITIDIPEERAARILHVVIIMCWVCHDLILCQGVRIIQIVRGFRYRGDHGAT